MRTKTPGDNPPNGNGNGNKPKTAKQTAYEIKLKSWGIAVPTHIYPWPRFGRSPDYMPDVFPTLVKTLLSTGRTKAEVAFELGICPSTIFDWTNKYPEFAEAINIGMELSRAWWDQVGRANLSNPYFNSTLYMMCRSNMHGWVRKDQVQTTFSGDVNVKTDKTDLGRLTKEELVELANLIAKAAPSSPAKS
jgi:hypothetical protein